MRQILHYCTFIKYLSIYSSVLPYQSTSRTADETKQRRKKTFGLSNVSLSVSSQSRTIVSLSSVSGFVSTRHFKCLYLDSIQARFKRHSAKSSPSLLVQTQSAPSDNLSCCFLSAWSGPVHRLPVSSSSTLDRNPLTPANIWLRSLFTHSLPDKSLCSRLRCFGSTPGGRCYQNITHQDCLKQVCLDVSTSLFYAVY